MSNDLIKELMNDYGKVLDVRNEYLHAGGNRLPWWNGTRHVDMCDLKSDLPPTIRVPYGQKIIKIKLWHRGQTLIECRWCKDHINKDEHVCSKKPQRRCYNCGSTSHVKMSARLRSNVSAASRLAISLVIVPNLQLWHPTLTISPAYPARRQFQNLNKSLKMNWYKNSAHLVWIHQIRVIQMKRQIAKQV